MNTPELTMTQISEMVGLHKSTVHRLLATLERMRFVERDPVTGIYKPGIRLAQLAYLTLEHNDIRQIAMPFMRALCEETRETIDLSVMDGTDVVFVDVVESPQRVKLAAAAGQRLPAFCTASGKAFLAFMPEEKVQRIIDQGMPKYTDFTVLDQQVLWKDLREARKLGYAISEQEYEDGISAVSAPIFDFSGQPLATIALAGPTFRLTRDKLAELAVRVLDTTRKVSDELQMAARPDFVPDLPDDEDED